MQLHQASAKYAQHRQQLDAIDPAEDVWQVFHYVDQGKVVYRLALHGALDGPLPDPVDPGYAEKRLITKQRGGARYFKSLDAVAAALLQIGQENLPLWDVPKPEGL